VHLWVADSGSGIPLDQQERIFEPFAASRSRPDGVGLGLSITRHLVALHQGLLTLESQLGAGSTFHVYLPLPDLQGQPAQLPPSAAPILLVLSQQQQLTPEISALITRLDLPLHRPRNVTELNTLLATSQPTAVVWDLNHAAPGDWAMVQQLRANPALCTVPLLLFGQSDGALPDLTMGVTEFFLKPLSDTNLVKSIQTLSPASQLDPILIVDDDPAARANYRDLLTRAMPQRRLIEAEDGATALDLLEHERPGLMLLDLLMPGIDGFTVLEELRASPATRQIPVLVLSGRLLSAEDVQRLQHAQVTFQSKETLHPNELAAEAARIIAGENALAAATSSFVKQAIAYIHEHYDQGFTRQELAGYIGLNERYLSEIFHQEMGLSPWEYLNRLRIALARQRLTTTNDAISDIAVQVGFEDARYFGRVFRRLTGLTPSAYREQERLQIADCRL
jgi:AraC-like DNA-binding protein